MSLRLGLLLSGGTESDGGGVAELSVQLARAASEVDFAHLVCGQHFLTSPQTYLQPIPLLARLAPEVPNMQLVTGVLLLPLLHPVQLAEELATLDALSGGRLVVGVGQGYRDVEFDAFGVDRSERRSRQLEALEVIKELWSGRPVHHEGRHYSVHAEGPAMLPVQVPHPPIWYAASTGPSLRRAHRSGYVPYLGPQVSRRDIEQLLSLDEGQTATVALRRDLLVTDVVGEAAARDCIAAHEARYSSWGYGHDGQATSPRDLYITGTAAECREQLAAYEAMGITDVVLRVTWPGLPAAASLAMLGAMSEVSDKDVPQ